MKIDSPSIFRCSGVSSHGLKMTEESKSSSDKRFCECGCQQEVSGFNYRTQKPNRFKSGHNMRGPTNHFWAGGSFITVRGYKKIKLWGHHRADKEGYVFEHIVIMENFLGRRITVDEHVHHINRDKHDNRIANLKVMNPTDHISHDRTVDMSKRVCPDCGRTTAEIGRVWFKQPDGNLLCPRDHKKRRRKEKANKS